MSSDRREFIEGLVASAAELPSPTKPLRKRVMKSARLAQRRRTVRRRIQWSLGGSALAIAIAAWVNAIITPAPNANSAGYRHSAPGVSPGAANSDHPDWDLVDSVKRERAEQAGVIHGSF